MKSAFIFFILFPISLLGQKINSTEKKSKVNIYNDAIKQYLIDLNRGETIKADTLFVEKNESFSDSLLNTIQGCFIKVVDYIEVGTKAEQEGPFILHKFFTLKYDNGLFYISVVPFTITKTIQGVNLGNGGACKMYYSFDNGLKQFKFIKITCWGI